MTEKKFRVAEIFGPTIQGEGRNVGIPCSFIRFGGCDFRCSWCDTPHAVLPEEVAKLPQMDAFEIIQALDLLSEDLSPNWVVLSGGNPALLDLGYLIHLLHVRRQKVMLETQGSVFKEWFGKVDDICFSPKPPSAGNETDLNQLEVIIAQTLGVLAENSDDWFTMPYLKVPIFTHEDLEYAREVRFKFSSLEMFLSIGNQDPGLPTVSRPTGFTGYPAPPLETSEIVLQDYRSWVKVILKDQDFADCRIFPQQHVLLWGNARGR
jgi:7-carboxy-7-deazaguanine synthase